MKRLYLIIALLMAGLSVRADYPTDVLADSPVVYLRLDQSSGTTATDSSGRGNNGTYTGGFTLSQSGLITGGNAAVALNGTSGYIDIGTPSVLSTTNTITLEGWFKFSAFPTGTLSADNSTYAVLISKGYDGSNEGYLMRISNEGGTRTLQVGSYQQTTTTFFKAEVSAASFSTGVAYHFVGLYDGTAWKLYTNGALAASVTTNTGPVASTASVVVGAEDLSGGRNRYFNGVVDEVAIYTNALSAARILNHYTNGISGASDTNGPMITAKFVTNDGSAIVLTFNEAVTGLNTTNYAITVGGNPHGIASVSGSGTAWYLELGSRWILTNHAVTLAYTGTNTVDLNGNGLTNFSSVAITNVSQINTNQIEYLSRYRGLFLHFNMSTFVDLEWANGNESPSTFYPTNMSIDNWVLTAKELGAQYAVLTAKHHDGFCLWPSRQTSHTIAYSSWYTNNNRTDILAQYVSKFRASGVAVVVYFSMWDKNWEAANPGYTPAQQITFITNQLTEILTQYGPIDLLWFDGWGWKYGYSAPDYASVIAHIKRLQPNCVVAENSHERSLAHTEIDIWEVPFEGPVSSTNRLPAETADTIRGDDNWFWKLAADTPKSLSYISNAIASANSRRSTFLLNIPPDRVGIIGTNEILRASQVGTTIFQPSSRPIYTRSLNGLASPY